MNYHAFLIFFYTCSMLLVWSKEGRIGEDRKAALERT